MTNATRPLVEFYDFTLIAAGYKFAYKLIRNFWQCNFPKRNARQVHGKKLTEMFIS